MLNFIKKRLKKSFTMSLSKFYLTKLQSLEDKYIAITQKLSDPETMTNQELYTKLAKELSSLEEIVKTYKYTRNV